MLLPHVPSSRLVLGSMRGIYIGLSGFITYSQAAILKMKSGTLASFLKSSHNKFMFNSTFWYNMTLKPCKLGFAFSYFLLFVLWCGVVFNLKLPEKLQLHMVYVLLLFPWFPTCWMVQAIFPLCRRQLPLFYLRVLQLGLNYYVTFMFNFWAAL